MTRTDVESTILRLNVWVRKAQGSCGGCAECDNALDDLEDLRQHDEALQAYVAELERQAAPVRDTGKVRR